MVKKVFRLCMIFVNLLFVACGSHVYSDENEAPLPVEQESKIEQADKLFLASADNKNLYTFETNKQKYLSSKGTTFWSVKKNNTANKLFTTRTVRVVKESGSPKAGFGMVFCVQESQSKGSFNMFAVLLNTNGQYAVGKLIKGNYTNIQWWTDSNFINRGFGAINYIRVEYNSETMEFTLFINDSELLKFSDSDSSPRLNYGSDGYVAVLDGKEDFSVSNTKITFLEIGEN